jgi:hypothetical protein
MRTSSRIRVLVVLLVLSALRWPAGSPLTAQVVINEVLAGNRETNLDEDSDPSDWVELYNVGATAIDLAGYALTDDPDNLARWVFPSTEIAPAEHLLIWCSGKDRTKYDSALLTQVNSPILFEPRYITLADGWSYLAAPPETDGPPADWHARDFDDSAWPVGVAGFGFGAEDIRAEVAPGTTAMFLRRRFVLEPSQRTLLLEIRYDDGFVAYLNGERVANSRLFGEVEPNFGTVSNRTHGATRSERYDLSPAIAQLHDGENVLAIALVNVRNTSNDMVVFAELGTAPPVLHTNFKISQQGEPLLLLDANGTLADAVNLPGQSADQSYGRSPDGTGDFLYHITPTPRAKNEGAASPHPLRVTETQFSHDRGLYDTPFDLRIETATAGATIRYTTDGSVPTAGGDLGEDGEPVPPVGTLYAGPIRIASTTVLRARAFLEGSSPTEVGTHTYLFVEEISGQDAVSTVAAGFPARWGSIAADYDMDIDVIGPGDLFKGIYSDRLPEALRSLPSLSIVLPNADLFGSSGIYSRPTSDGDLWERAASVELLSPDDDESVQENCGLRIQGGYFRDPGATRKHSLRLLFKSQYGAPKLNFPLFGPEATDSFDTITLRAGANDGYSWSAARLTEQYTRDEFGRRLQLATGNAASHGRFVHLYLNGLYWGLYNPAERPDRSFSATYYGGDKDNWDSVHDLRATSGTLDAWNQMLETARLAARSIDAYLELQGLAPDGSRNLALPHLLDLPNYVDYLVVNLWGGNWDWPWKNWWAGRERSPTSTGFKFYSWDFENTMGNNRGRSPLEKNAIENDFSSAGEPHRRLRPNAEYRLLFADRIHRLVVDGGPLTPASLVVRYREISDSVELAMIAESARWGDQHHGTPLTLKEWQDERDWLIETYLPQRTDVVMGQFRAAGLYPTVDAPVFTPHGGTVVTGTNVLSAPNEGAIYTTLDGSDPRAIGGAVNSGALEIDSTGLAIDETVRLRARTLLGKEWSALTEADFIVDSDIALRITEIMYHPPAPGGDGEADDREFDSEDFEFVELQNVGAATLELSEVTLSGGVAFAFAESAIEELAPNETLVVVKNLAAFESRYATGHWVAGEYDGRLGNDGDTLRLQGFLGEPILAFAYDDNWYDDTDGAGFSLVIADPLAPRESWGERTSWRSGDALLGTPGEAEGDVELGGLQRPGDSNQDGRVNVADAVNFLDRLFSAEGQAPCRGGSILEGGNRTLHDFDAGGTVNITDAILLLEYVFRRGAPPTLGTSCLPITGCPSACSDSE